MGFRQECHFSSSISSHRKHFWAKHPANKSVELAQENKIGRRFVGRKWLNAREFWLRIELISMKFTNFKWLRMNIHAFTYHLPPAFAGGTRPAHAKNDVWKRFARTVTRLVFNILGRKALFSGILRTRVSLLVRDYPGYFVNIHCNPPGCIISRQHLWAGPGPRTRRTTFGNVLLGP